MVYYFLVKGAVAIAICYKINTLSPKRMAAIFQTTL